jgi:hypothetical protein
MGNIAQLQVRKVSDVIGRVGQVISPPHNTRTENLPHTTGRAKQVYTFTVPAAPTATTVYSVTALGETASFIATGVRAADIAGLAAAVNANPILLAVFVVSTSATAVLLTGRQFGNDIDATAADEGLAEITFSETTAPSESNSISVARAIFLDADKNATATVPATLATFRGFTTFRYASEQTGVGTNDSDLYVGVEDAEILRGGMMIVPDGSTAEKGDSIFIGTDGKAYGAGAGTSTSIEYTPTVQNGAVYNITLQIDGTPYTAVFVSDATASAQEIVEGLKAQLDALVPAGVATTTEDNVTMVIALTDASSSLSEASSANLAAVVTTDETRLKLDASKGTWFAANIIELRG